MWIWLFGAAVCLLGILVCFAPRWGESAGAVPCAPHSEPPTPPPARPTPRAQPPAPPAPTPPRPALTASPFLRRGAAVRHHRRGDGVVEAVDTAPCISVTVKFADGAVVRYSGGCLRNGRLRLSGVAPADPTAVAELREKKEERERRLAVLLHRCAVLTGTESDPPPPRHISALQPSAKAGLLERISPAFPSQVVPIPGWWDPESDEPPRDVPKAQGPSLLELLTDEQKLAMRSARGAIAARLGEEEAGAISDWELRRFLAARKWDEAAVVDNFEEAVEWRRSQPAGCPTCRVSPERHHFFLLGWDKQRRPVMYSCFRHNKDTDVATQLQHAVWVMNQAAAAMAPDVSRWVHLVNFAGFVMSDANPALGKQAARVLQRFFPERLGATLLIDQPWAFDVILRAVRAVASAKTMSKVRTVRTKDGTAAQAFAELFDPALAAYVQQLIRLSA